jgi:trimethylamine monooxygenase
MKDLAKDTDYPPLNIDACNEHFFEWEHDKAKDILSFRDKAFKSVLTGNMAIVHHTKW